MGSQTLLEEFFPRKKKGKGKNLKKFCKKVNAHKLFAPIPFIQMLLTNCGQKSGKVS